MSGPGGYTGGGFGDAPAQGFGQPQGYGQPQDQMAMQPQYNGNGQQVTRGDLGHKSLQKTKDQDGRFLA